MSGETKPEAQSAADESWEPNQNLLTVLLDMGFSRQIVTKALYATGNDSVDQAAAWILEGGESVQADGSERMHKMMFVVNMELNMGVGKVAAQVAHSALGIYQILLQDQDKWGQMLLNWQHFGETKIVLRGDSAKHLAELEKQAMLIGLPTYLVQDAGRTQVPSGSMTVLAIFGGMDHVEQVTGKLRLL